MHAGKKVRYLDESGKSEVYQYGGETLNGW